MTSKLNHGSTPKSDQKLEDEAAAHLASSPPLQLMTELYTRLRDMAFPWWTPEHLRTASPANARMQWFEARPDLRQKITTQLTGLAPKAARNKSPEFQADLIDSVVDSGDIDVGTFERAFEPSDVAIYGPTSEIWKLFRKRMPWDDDRTAHQDVIGWLLGALLADKSTLDGKPRTPILTAHAVRTAIDGRVWHTRIPLDVRVEIDNARFQAQKERPNEPFTAAQDLLIATPALIAASIPLKELNAVLDLAGVALGFEVASATPSPSPPTPGHRTSVAPPPPAVPAATPSPAASAYAAPKTPSVPPKAMPAKDATAKETPATKDAAPKESVVRETIKEIAAKDVARSKSVRPEPLNAPAHGEKSSKLDGAHKMEDPPTSDEKREFDELEHTNPWAVPGSLPEIGSLGDDPRPKADGAKKKD